MNCVDRPLRPITEKFNSRRSLTCFSAYLHHQKTKLSRHSLLVFLYSRLNITCTRSVYSHCTFITFIERVGFPHKDTRLLGNQFMNFWPYGRGKRRVNMNIFLLTYALADRRLLVRNSIEHYTTFSCRCKPVSPVQPDFLRRGKRFKNCHRI